MSDYTKATDFAAKDALLTGNPAKLVKGTEIDTEFNAISTAIASKADTADKLSVFAATTSAELAGVISDETGTGALVFANSPTLITPALGTPASGVLTNCTGTAAGLTAGNAANWTSVPANASQAEMETGTESANRMMSPLRVKQAVDAHSSNYSDTDVTALFTGTNVSKSANGYQKFPSGVIFQWMKISAATGTTAITFPTAFPTACCSVVGTLGTGAAYAWPVGVIEGTITTSGCSIYRNDSQPAYLMIIGY